MSEAIAQTPFADFFIRRFTPSDRDAVLSLLTDAFETPAEAQLVECLEQKDAVTAAYVAHSQGEIIGYCAFSPVTAAPTFSRQHLFGHPLLGLAPVAVAPEHQNRGVGHQLVSDALGDAALRFSPALIVVLGDPRYYQRFGFEPASNWGLTWDGGDVDEAFRAIAISDIPCDCDRSVSYHAAFDIFGD
ncbi:MAG: N-acetyltransferase [Pseudomonadota bacterium]